MPKKYFLVILLVILALPAGTMAWQTKLNFVPHVFYATFSASGEKFPDIDLANLSDSRRRIITLAKQEFTAQPDYKKYTEGNNEPWCADFTSWIYKSAGVPFTNPNSGSWRIPGTITLREYLKKENRLKDSPSGYTPQPGDLMLYDNPNPFGQHVNIVLKVSNDGSITTIGGNEPEGIRVKTHKANLDKGFVGYGVLK